MDYVMGYESDLNEFQYTHDHFIYAILTHRMVNH